MDEQEIIIVDNSEDIKLSDELYKWLCDDLEKAFK